jgi:hypothetical protein
MYVIYNIHWISNISSLYDIDYVYIYIYIYIIFSTNLENQFYLYNLHAAEQPFWWYGIVKIKIK